MGREITEVYYLPNVVDQNRFVVKLTPFRENIRILMVGRFYPQKRIDNFLICFFNLTTKNYPFEIIGDIVGDGPEREKLIKLAQRYGLYPDKVHFHGEVPDVERFYNDADIYLHTADNEGMPNTILEAMSCGLPVVAYKVGGISEIVQHGKTGFLVNLGDEENLINSLEILIKDRELRREMGANGGIFIEQNHSLEDSTQIS